MKIKMVIFVGALAALSTNMHYNHALASQHSYPRSEVRVVTEGFSGSLRSFFMFRLAGRCNAPAIAPRDQYETAAEYEERRRSSISSAPTLCENFELLIPWNLSYNADSEEFSLNWSHFVNRANNARLIRAFQETGTGGVTYNLLLNFEPPIVSQPANPPAFSMTTFQRNECRRIYDSRISITHGIRQARCRYSVNFNCDTASFRANRRYVDSVNVRGRCSASYAAIIRNPSDINSQRFQPRFSFPDFRDITIRSPIANARQLRDIEQNLFIRVRGSFVRSNTDGTIIHMEFRGRSIEFFRADTDESIASWGG